MLATTSHTVFKVLLFTDLVGSTDLKRRLGDASGAEIIAKHDVLFRDCLRRFSGVEWDNAGDGFFAVFDLPSDALRCALTFQVELRRLQVAEPLAVRVGIHLGEIVHLPGEGAEALQSKLVGLAVDTAARVMGLAAGGQVLLTRHAFDSVRQQVDSGPDGSQVEWLAHGPYTLKGIQDPIEIFEAGIPGISPLTPPPNSEKAKRAVAPGDEETLGWRPAIGLPIPGREGWKVERRLGEGGFGEVWLARHDRTHDVRTFKFCYDAGRLRSLKRELTLFRLLKEVLGNRADIARLYEVRLHESPYFIEMEYTAGGDLVDWSERRGGIKAVPLDQRLLIVGQIAHALAAAHSAGVIHKDVKPRNVLIDERGDDSVQAQLTDFGIGVLIDREQLLAKGITMTGFTEATLEGNESSRTGTRLYAAPELIMGKPPSIRTDIFALGVLLYQVVIGELDRPIAVGWENDVADEVLREDIAMCVAGQPEARLKRAEELAARLRDIDQRRAELMARRAAEARAARRRRRNRLIHVGAAFAGVVGITAGIAAWRLHESQATISTLQDQLGELAKRAQLSATLGLAALPVELPPADESLIQNDATVYVELSTAPKKLTPLHMVEPSGELEACELLFEKLFWRTRDMKLVPNEHLVARIDDVPDDPCVKVVHLQPDLRWHDGHPLTAKDAEFSWEQTLQPEVGSAKRDTASRLREVKALDDVTLCVVLAEPHLTWRHSLNFELVPMHLFAAGLPEDATLRSSAYFQQLHHHPVGCGPLKFVSWSEREIVLRRWPEYSGPKVRFETAILRWEPDAGLRFAAFLAGKLDICKLDNRQYHSDIQDPEFVSMGHPAGLPSNTFTYIIWNCECPFFADGRVRRAMASAIDLQQIRQEVTYDLAAACYGPWPPDSPYFNSAVRPLALDMDDAARLLDEAGWRLGSDGWRHETATGQARVDSGQPFRFRLMVERGGDASNQIAQILKKRLSRLGVEVVIDPADWPGEFTTRRRNSDFDAIINSTAQPVDPERMRQTFASGVATNFGHYHNAAVDRLFDEAARELDEEKRAEKFRQIHRLVYEDQPLTYLYFKPSLWAVNKRLRGVEFSPRGPLWFDPGTRNWWVPR